MTRTAPVTPAQTPAVVDGVDVDAVARAVRACAGVSDLDSGRFGEIASYLPGRRIGGVLVDDTTVSVHVRVRWGHTTRDVLAQVSAVTEALRHGRRLALFVDDVDDPTDTAGSSVDAESAVAPPLAIEPARSAAPPTTTTLTESRTS